MRKPLYFLFACLPALAQVPPTVEGAVASRQVQEQSLRDFDIRQRPRAQSPETAPERKTLQDPALIQQRKAQLEAYRAAAEAEGRRGLRLSVNTFGLPKSISNVIEPLSDPSTQDPVVIAKNFLRARRDLFLLSEDDLATLRLVGKDISDGGLSFLHFNQSVNGIDVYRGHVKIALNAAGQVIQAGAGEIIPQLRITAKSALSAREAVLAAFASLGLDLPSELQPLPSREARQTEFRNPAGERYNPVLAELSIFPMTPASARLAYRISLEAGETGAYEILIDAQDGRLLLRRGLTYTMGQARVWKKSPIAGDRELVDFPAGWLPPDGAVTTGNNADAYLHASAAGGPDAEPPADIENGRASSASQFFDFPAAEGSTGANPRDFRAAAVTNLFYLVNAAHDYFYDLGFTEQAGNFQTDNFELGGKQDDPVQAEAQAEINNASFWSLWDGSPGRMRMGIFRQGTEEEDDDRDSSYSAQIVFHEYAHGVTNRIVGGPSSFACLSGTQSRGLGEGWSDYFSISYTDDPVEGAYLTGDSERGIRRQSYEGYTFTYEDLGNSGFVAPHPEGEIWAAALWNLRNELGQEAVDKLVMDGLKLTPCNPDMIDARDAVLTALESDAAKDAADRAAAWEVFARRGMGYAAGGFNGSAFEGTVFTASFDLPPDLQPGNRSPVIAGRPTVTPGLGDNYVYDIEAEDPDGEDPIYELTDGPEGMTVDPATGTVRWMAGFTPQRAKIDVTDGAGGRTVHGFHIPVKTFLTPSRPVTIGGERYSTGYAVVNVPFDVPVLQVTLRGGRGNAFLDLIEPSGFLPVGSSVNPDTSQTISISAPQAGAWSVEVFGLNEYASVSLEASLPVPTPIDANTQLPDLAAEETSETFYRVTVPPETDSFTVSTEGGLGNVDLYVKSRRPAACSGPFVFFYDCVFDESSDEPDTAERIVIDNPEPGEWFIALVASDAYSGVTLTTAATADKVRIFEGGVALATQTPVIPSISPGAIVSVFGRNFAPEGTSAVSPELDEEGRIAAVLAGTCLEIDGERARMLAVSDRQINAQVPESLSPGRAEVVVVRGCGAANEERSATIAVEAAAVSPGFFNFVNNADGVNPIAALHGGGPGLVGEPGLLPGGEFTPAEPGEFVSFFGAGFGATDPPLAAGEIPLRALAESGGLARLVNEVAFAVDGIPVPAEDVFYAGAAPCCAGLQQFVVKIPDSASDGNLPVRAIVGGVPTPAGPYVTVRRRQ